MRYLLSIIILLALCIPADAIVFFIQPAPSGGGGACTTSNDGVVAAVAGTSSGLYNIGASGSRISITATTDVTEYVIQVCDSGSNAGSIDVTLFSDNANEPGSTVDSGLTKEIPTSALPDCDSYDYTTVTLDATYQNLPAGTYWLHVQEIGAAIVKVGYSIATGEKWCVDPEWDCYVDYQGGEMEVYGCQ